MRTEQQEHVGRLATSFFVALMQSVKSPDGRCMACGTHPMGMPATPVPGETQDLSRPAGLLTTGQVAEMLGISRTKVYELMRRLELDSIQVGRSRRVLPSAVQRYIDGRVEAEEF